MDPVDDVVDPIHYPVWTFPVGLKFRTLPFYSSWLVQPHSFSELQPPNSTFRAFSLPRRYSPSNSLRRGFPLGYSATMFFIELPSSQRRDGIRPRTPSVAASYSAILRRCSPSNSLRRSSAIPATVFSLELPPSQRRDSIRPRTPSVTPSVTPVVPLNSSTGNSSSGGDRLFHTASSLLLLLRRTSYKKRMRELCFVFGIM